jgi:hypothetical protein
MESGPACGGCGATFQRNNWQKCWPSYLLVPYQAVYFTCLGCPAQWNGIGRQTTSRQTTEPITVEELNCGQGYKSDGNMLVDLLEVICRAISFH